MATQTKNPKAQISFARAAAPRRVLVTLLADRQIREYDLEGKVAGNGLPTSPGKRRTTAQRSHPCQPTRGRLVEVNAAGKIVWQMTPKDFDKPYLNGLSNFRILANGTHLCRRQLETKIGRLMEFSRDKKLVWHASQPNRQPPRHFHILTTNGKPIPAPPLR